MTLHRPLASSPHATRAAALLAALAVTACAGVRPVHNTVETEPGGVVITRADLEQIGARDAMDALLRSRTHIKVQRTGANHAPRVTHRGVGTFNLNSSVLVVIDGTRGDFIESELRNIVADNIVFIQILSGHEAAVKYGSEAGNGVILIKTSARL